jgi:predicted nucleotidyltransferase
MVHAARDGASQREIARRAGVSQPYVSQVIAANQNRFVPTTERGYLLAGHRRGVRDIVERYRARDVAVFGSVARGEDGPQSDIDLLVDIPEDMGLITLATMEQEITELLGTPVDVVPARLLHSHVRQGAERDAMPL